MSALKTIASHENRLDYLFEKSSQFSSDAEMLSEWTKYLCVLTCGFVEQSIKRIYEAYVVHHANKEVNRYVERTLKRHRNPKMENICQIAGHFSKAWSKELEDKAEGQLKDSIDSIVANRHRIAHGEDVNLGLPKMKQYYKDALSVLDLLKQQTGLT